MAKKAAKAKIEDLPLVLDLKDEEVRATVAQAIALATGGILVGQRSAGSGKQANVSYHEVLLPAGRITRSMSRRLFTVVAEQCDGTIEYFWTPTHNPFDDTQGDSKCVDDTK